MNCTSLLKTVRGIFGEGVKFIEHELSSQGIKWQAIP
jgi:hypothetical protein